MFKAFVQAHESDMSITLMDWTNSPTGDSYRDAVEARRAKSNNLKALQTAGQGDDVVKRRETFETAMATTEFKEA